MKQFLLFAGDNYYPYGGWEDFVGDFESIEEATQGVKSYHDWAHIVDLELGVEKNIK